VVPSSKPAVLLTANEYRAAIEDAGWVLAVVTRAVTARKVTLYRSDERPTPRTRTCTELTSRRYHLSDS
jgi:hypothetical protein